ncbi:Hypothetical protein R9X50_00165100 [Acrodontium crateriforme]|uniref:Zn(2)-C6 fungal-type domain-containing protein n=1 Tax=Acrodontium crateriforme TaxID=150365 RepID=A0AAQ3LZV1_9PEZI|nr:Hypothetical protein R9X50_00165100 [Acrodontium crateriforme]
MVGRNWSKGCRSCRRRHLKCDEARPSCLRCRRGGFECEGYNALQIVGFAPVTEKSSAAVKARKKQISLNRLVAPVIDDSVMIAHLVYAMFSLPAGDKEYALAWPGLAASNDPGSLASKCLNSLAESYFGSAREDQALSRQGRQSYIACLRSINDNLGDLAKRTTVDTLMSTAILGTYEMLFLTSEHGWIKHGLGTAALLKMRGPDMSESDSFEVFQASRFFILLTSLATCQTTFLSCHQWKSQPWISRGVEKSSMDLLLDIITDVTDLRSRYHVRKKYGQDALSEDEGIFETAMGILEDLRQWRLKWQTLPEAQSTIISCEDDGSEKSWSARLEFSSLYAANSYCLYDAATILAIEIAMFSAKAEDLKPGDASVLFVTAREAGIEICRSIDYQLSSSIGKIGHLTVLWPLRMAFKVLKDTVDGRWLEDKIREIMSTADSWSISEQSLTFQPNLEAG